MGWGRDDIRAAVGYRFIPGTVGMLLRPKPLRSSTTPRRLLDIPDRGRPVDPDACVRLRSPSCLTREPEPRPVLDQPQREMAALNRWRAQVETKDPGHNRAAQNGDPWSMGSWIVARFSNRVIFFMNVS